MRTLATVAGFLLACVGLAALAWPFPLFTLNEPYFSWYGELLFGPSFSRPGGAGAAAPFLWIVTAPLGVAAMAVGVPILYWGQKRTERDANGRS